MESAVLVTISHIAAAWAGISSLGTVIRRQYAISIFAALIGAFVPGLTRSAQDKSVGTFDVERVFPNLSFEQPVFLTHSGDGSKRLFVVERRGRIWVFANNRKTVEKQEFLDLSSAVIVKNWEQGLLGLAFHPRYEKNGFLYVDYTAPKPSRTVISRFTRSADNANEVDANSEKILLEIRQPHGNHNGGMLMFGKDGYLYVGMGDGGSGGDPKRHGQNRATLLATVLRIDVDHTAGGLPYAIPKDNPFVGNDEGRREEIWAFGLRNPWRFSQDPATGRIWCGDVGQSNYEEIDILVRGGNYGWRFMEGRNIFRKRRYTGAKLTSPVVQYGRHLGMSVTGGYVYRGAQPDLRRLRGRYIYGDFESGRIWALTVEEGREPDNQLVVDSPLNISSFGVDAAQELYVLDYESGQIYGLVRK